MKRDFISLSDFSRDDLGAMFDLTRWMKEKRPPAFRPLSGKTAALVFEKPSLRTHVSFEVGVAQMGGTAVYLAQQQIGVGSREPVRDIAMVLSSYADLIVARTLRHETVVEFSRHSSVPVVNALTDRSHPCQILGDAYTLMERGLFGPEMKIVFVGDGNNVVNSWLELAGIMPFRFVLACPKGYEPDPSILERARSAAVSPVQVCNDPREAAAGADVLYTDVWVSMGQESEQEARRRDFRGFQVDAALLALAKKSCVVMHCLPARRGEEITADVLEGPQSIVIPQAANRLHAQKGMMAFLFDHRMS